jgi:hypothetical protein
MLVGLLLLLLLLLLQPMVASNPLSIMDTSGSPDVLLLLSHHNFRDFLEWTGLTAGLTELAVALLLWKDSSPARSSARTPAGVVVECMPFAADELAVSARRRPSIWDCDSVVFFSAAFSPLLSNSKENKCSAAPCMDCIFTPRSKSKSILTLGAPPRAPPPSSRFVVLDVLNALLSSPGPLSSLLVLPPGSAILEISFFF